MSTTDLDTLFIADHEPVRASELDDNGAALAAAGLAEVSPTGWVVLTLDGIDRVHALRGAS